MSCILLVTGRPAQAAETTGSSASAAAQVIETFHAELVDTLRQADKLSFEERRDKLAPAVKNAFDTRFMSRVAAGTKWQSFSEEQRETLSEAFRAMTVANYAARFNRDKGQRFEVLDEQPANRDRVLVRTRLKRRGGDPVDINYLVHPTGDGWSIIDVHLEGKVSELALRRSEFEPILRDKGYDALIDVLHAKVEQLSSEEVSEGS